MSVAYSLICLACDAEAPELGDMGVMGFPSLSVDERKLKKFVPQNFGYLYEGFLSIGLLTEPMDDFLRFLYDHAGHQLFQNAEDEDPYEDDYEKVWYQKARDATVGPPKPAEGLKYEQARFVAECAKCATSFPSEHSDMARVENSRNLTAAAVEVFLSRVVKRLSDDFHRSEPFDSTDLDDLGRFLKKHREHGPDIRLIATAQA